MVFSTLHTNNAIGAVPRLVDMGVDPYLIAPTLILSAAQRLARMTCPSSRKLVPMDASIKLQIDEQLKDLPEEFRSCISTMAYERGHSAGSEECLINVKRYVKDLKDPIEKFKNRIINTSQFV